jgi:hypothetical protein
MDNAQLYIDFVEGRLDKDSLADFTRNLATDSEFLAGFQNFLLITQTVSSHAAKIKAPADLTDSLYEKLGFSLHPEMNALKPAGPINKILPSWSGRFMKGMMSGAFVAALLLFAAYNLYLKPGNNSAYHPADQIPKVVAGLASIPAKAAEKQIKKDNNVIHVINSKSSPAAQEPRPMPEFTDTNPDTDRSFNQTALLPADKNIPGGPSPRFSAAGAPGLLLNNTQSTVLPYSNPEDLNISVEFNNSAVWDIPHPEIAYKSVSPFNNLCLSLFYHFNSYLKAGLEVRQESYFFEYYGTEPDSILYKYQQHSNFTSFGIKLAYAPFQAGRFRPNVQIGAGVNPGGFAIRPSIGFDYNLYPNLSVAFGAEYTRFWYIHQSQLNNTSKLGLNYGLIYNF